MLAQFLPFLQMVKEFELNELDKVYDFIVYSIVSCYLCRMKNENFG